MEDLSTRKNLVLENMRSSRNQVERSLAAIKKNRSLDAEDEGDRKAARINRLLPGLKPEFVDKVRNYDSSVTNLIPEQQRLALDSLWGMDTKKDLVGVAYLELARAAARSVGRIIHKNTLEAKGTGFLISDKLLVTNYHVICHPDVAKDLMIEFNYELDAYGNPKPTEKFGLNPDKFFLSNEQTRSAIDSLDFTIVAVAATPKQLFKFGFCPLSKEKDKHTKGEFATIIQHPSGGYKQIALRENRLVARLDNPPVLHYVSDVEHGSSGSPVFDDQWRVIGLHHAQYPSVEAYPDGIEVPAWMKEAARASGIVNYVEKYIAEHSEQFSVEQRDLIDRAFNCSFSGPSLIAKVNND